MLSAFSNFSGSLPAVTPTKTTIQTAKTIHFARRPDGNENTEPFIAYDDYQSSADNSFAVVTGARQAKLSQT